MKLHLRDRVWEKEAPLVMGILNVTPDSFSDGGSYGDLESALLHARQMHDEGADIIDVGGESTRPGARKVSVEEEMERVVPVISAIKKELPTLVSVDTYKMEVAQRAVEEGGADIVNDISALAFSPGMAPLISRLQVPVVLMHIKGTPENMQQDPYYDDVIGELVQYFAGRIAAAEEGGIHRDRLILDPGIGFGKRLDDNVAILQQLGAFRRFQLPILVGVSRKSFLGKISGQEIPHKREAETIAAGLAALRGGAAILRVHDVRPMKAAIQVASRLGLLSVGKKSVFKREGREEIQAKSLRR